MLHLRVPVAEIRARAGGVMEQITTAAGLDALVDGMDDGEWVLVTDAHGRPWLIHSDEDTLWTASYPSSTDDVSDDGVGLLTDPALLALPVTVLYRPDAEPAPVKPSREDVARVLLAADEETIGYERRYRDVGGWDGYLPDADAVLALLPGRTVAEVKAEALEEAAAELGRLVSIQSPDAAISISVETWLAGRAASLRGEVDE